MKGRTWTGAEDDVLLQGIAAGRTQAAIAESLGRPLTSIGSRIDTLGYRDPQRLDAARSGRFVPQQVSASAGIRLTDTGRRKQRKCLGASCGRMFSSAHAGNRLCPLCRQAATNASPFAALIA